MLAALLILAAATQPPAPPGRERLLMDLGWSFSLGRVGDVDGKGLIKAGEASAAPRTWRAVELPHDWAALLPFDPKADRGHGYKAIGPGYPDSSVGWYRRAFQLPASDLGRRLSVELDGVFRDAMVWLNGHYLGRHESGYTSFAFDVTDVATYGGANELVVRADASAFEGWFYEGAGIYRHVWLVKTAPLHVERWGVVVTTAGGTVTARTRVVNEGGAPVPVTVESAVVDGDGKTVARGQARGPGEPGTVELTSKMRVPSPRLWSPESPALYRLLTRVRGGGTVVDEVSTTFGFRTVAFDANRGFLLNGKPYVIKGTCNHQDHAGVGGAIPDALQEFRLRRLKEMGSNAYRTSHNAPTPELLDLCDRLGMLVMDETRSMGNREQLESLVRRDRNHPSVAIWSIGNEERHIQDTPVGARVAASMQALVRALDATRPITYAANDGERDQGINAVIEVRGWNYKAIDGAADRYRARHPDQPQVGTEQASTLATRDEYANDPARVVMSAYDDNAPRWGATAQAWWSYFADRPFLAGGFVWTGFDYRGEPTPYSWPAVGSQFGVLDSCGFAKDDFYYYQAWWSDRPVVHVLPHWNWSAGRAVDVRVFSSCQEVALSLNGKLLGRRPVPPRGDVRFSVPFQPGSLEAQCLRDGKVLASDSRATAGPAHAIHLEPWRPTLAADGEDVAVLTVSVVDQSGRRVPDASHPIHFALAGPARLLGTGNGDPASHEPEQDPSRRVFHGLAQVLLQSRRGQPGLVTLQASSPGLLPATLKLDSQAAALRPAVP